MHKPSKNESTSPSGNLKHNFETALIRLYEADPKAVARRSPIYQRVADPKRQALTVAATALATLWGV